MIDFKTLTSALVLTSLLSVSSAFAMDGDVDPVVGHQAVGPQQKAVDTAETEQGDVSSDATNAFTHRQRKHKHIHHHHHAETPLCAYVLGTVKNPVVMVNPSLPEIERSLNNQLLFLEKNLEKDNEDSNTAFSHQPVDQQKKAADQEEQNVLTALSELSPEDKEAITRKITGTFSGEYRKESSSYIPSYAIGHGGGEFEYQPFRSYYFSYDGMPVKSNEKTDW